MRDLGDVGIPHCNRFVTGVTGDGLYWSKHRPVYARKHRAGNDRRLRYAVDLSENPYRLVKTIQHAAPGIYLPYLPRKSADT